MKETERKRPGMPRKREVLDRITLRLSRPLALRMNSACDHEDLSQREFVEQAVALYCEGEPRDTAPPQTDEVYRTGMWIDPRVVTLMDRREAEEGITQRELLERAVALRLAQSERV